jgi:hypothetical protein
MICERRWAIMRDEEQDIELVPSKDFKGECPYGKSSKVDKGNTKAGFRTDLIPKNDAT